MSLHRTRIKLCGLTQPADVDHAVALGADAIGLVFYPPSPRYVATDRAAELARRAGPFVTVTGLFVNASADDVARVLDQVPLTLLQFHGDETPEQCAEIAGKVGLPWLRALRVQPGADLVEFADRFAAAQGLLLDAFVEGYGGGGHVFDWTLIPPQWLSHSALPSAAPRLVLSGGLSAQNVAGAIERVRPYAVDVSSGIEAARGVKDHARMTAFVRAVREADAALGASAQA
ncbi:MULTISPECIES: phosphoribosylanthranilate isomerase [Ralstonia]|jgi:phosphoribosylanthranilate isomerase|uniref:N-(5'-phosphoribosyl)anthranilate isomerase n=1 Tax=Ralstonia mannitolilytica TaxID=105219 RepID=A0AAJ4ZK59_9RALS|nr:MULTISPECIES: phosphoribosylanthranilate isomerase [Ralstonia]PLT19525.1 phosphoribosylanthranilate isomerase [Ralstonia mannitolilytica]CAG2152405.1 N-(5'-phosphoribosyl)anthranilate isomerase [Ralstonia mannitolilytica]CAJ0734591.1 N-(5'-phosphoribosyl)anthranilate isomerase [Ralstonia mannitolilytica]SUD87316.1 N-(5'-phosphoribosyl)anthranilate isomerase [Ralstonia mannitolilytica]SUD93243.1 N-(5'-phosphoribosyl)anthranilate isomerase [Ralstonia mannitolilytica]